MVVLHNGRRVRLASTQSPKAKWLAYGGQAGASVGAMCCGDTGRRSPRRLARRARRPWWADAPNEGGRVGTFRLWSDEIEAMRPEARAVIEAGVAAMPIGEPAADLRSTERIAVARGHGGHDVPARRHRGAVIAGVPCRIRRAEGTPRRSTSTSTAAA